MLKLPLFRQRGAFSILAAGTLMMALGCLMLVLDTGRLYMEQRKLQKLADTAALEAVARLNEGDCSKSPGLVQTNAIENATSNGFLINGTQSIATRCVKVNTDDGLRVPTPDASGHAVQAIATETVPASLIFRAGSMLGLSDKNEISLQARAVAEREGGEPIAAFSIGAELLKLNSDGLVGLILKSAGVDVNTLTILNSNGLADVAISPAGLLHALEIDVSIHELKALSPQRLIDLTDTKVGLLSLEELIALSVNVVSDSALKLALTTLREDILIAPILEEIEVNIFGLADENALFTLATNPDRAAGPALDTQLKLSDLLSTVILLGAGGRGIEIPELGILGLARVELGVVEPPSIAIGPVGTQAYNAQVRAYINIDTNKTLSSSSILKNLAGALVRIQLPLWIDVTTATAKFEQANCSTPPPSADMLVNSKILNVCLGEIPDENKWSTSLSCDASLQDTDIASILGGTLLKISGSAYIPALTYSEPVDNMLAGESQATGPNNLRLGDTVSDIVTQLTELISDIIDSDSSKGLLGDLLSGLMDIIDLLTGGLLGTTVNAIVHDLISVVTPILNTIGEAILSPLLSSLLGTDAGVGKSYLELYDLNCGAPRLVN
ncbi:pilus assembly protein TadG-related protein [Oceanisphaera sp. KMM 10153]|uniref:pilus assembly protein TadG-related protein n=1 Tax=Oceanisphaera submarina TaxID=3390193 RepID=UPI003975DE9E